MTEKKEQRSRADNKRLIIGAVILLAATLIMRILSVILAEVGESSVWANRILFAAIYVIDDVIFAAGAAMIAYFLLRGKKKPAYLSLFFALFILAVDFAASYVIALVLDYTNSSVFVLVNGAVFGESALPGGIAFLSNVIVLVLNLALRAVSFLTLAAITPRFLRGTYSQDEPMPIISLSHPACRAVLAASVLRMVPYLVYEVYSSISFVVKNAGTMKLEYVLNMLPYYGEILIDGIITYFAVYIIMACVSLAGKEKAEK